MKRKINFTYLCYANTYFFYYFSMGVFISTLSIYLTDIGIGTRNLSFIISATALFTIVMQPLLGIIADKTRNGILTVTVSIAITFFCGVGFLFTKNLVLLFLFNGIAQSLIISVMPLLDNLTTETSFHFGKIRLWGSIGYAVSVQIIGYMYDHVSHRSVFVTFGITTILSLLTLAGFKQGTVVKTTKTISFSEGIKNLASNRLYLVFALLSLTILGMHYCNISYMPILVSEIGGSATSVGTILLMQSVFEIPLLLFSERIIKFLNLRGCLIMITLLMSIRWLLYSLHISLGWMLALFFFQALTTCLFFVVSLKIVTSIVDAKYTNTALSIASMLGKGMGALTFQLIGGHILDTTGTTFLYLFLTLIGSFSVLLSLMFRTNGKTIVKQS